MTPGSVNVTLINAGLPSGVASCLRTLAYPPLSTAYLATFLKRSLPGVEVSVVDDQFGDVAEADVLRKSTLIGISANTITYPRAVEIAKRVKSLGVSAPIVLGGIHAILRARQILARQDCFDFICTGQGEDTLVSLLEGREPSDVPNLLRRTPQGDVASTRKKFRPISRLPVPDFNLLPLERYASSFGRQYSNKSGHRPAAFLSSTGCDWRLRSGGCTFCSIPHSPSSRLTPQAFWHHVCQIEARTAATFLWDVSDTFTSDPRWLTALAAARPDSCGVRLHVYARGGDIRDSATAADLRRIGVQEVLLGAESFDDRLLRRCHKGVTSSRLLRSVDILKKEGIRIALSLIFGLPGEDARSLGQTLAVCRSLRAAGVISEMHASVVTPLPGSRLFEELVLRLPSLAYARDSDFVPHEDIFDAYLPASTRCTKEQLFSAFVAVDNMFPSAGPFYLSTSSPAFGSLGYRGII